MGKEQTFYECMRCSRKIAKEEYETYSGLCHEIEIDELTLKMIVALMIFGKV